MIGILNAYYFDKTQGHYQEKYTPLILQFVQKVFPHEQIKSYEIAFDHWPASVDECAVWLITGSAKSAYDEDHWVKQLQAFIIEIHRRRKKLIGICFGHQIVAQALGGEVKKCPKGWGVGVKQIEIVATQSWMQPQQNQATLYFSHQDQVTKLPPEAKLLALNDFCPYQMLQIGDHILTIQGHPEFNAEFAKARLMAHKKKISLETYETALKSLNKTTDGDMLTEWIRCFCYTNANR